MKRQKAYEWREKKVSEWKEKKVTNGKKKRLRMNGKKVTNETSNKGYERNKTTKVPNETRQQKLRMKQDNKSYE